MTRSEALLELASVVRRSHGAALAVVGWWAAAASEEDVMACLTLVHEWSDLEHLPTHLQAYRERYSAGPDSRP